MCVGRYGVCVGRYGVCVKIRYVWKGTWYVGTATWICYHPCISVHDAYVLWGACGCREGYFLSSVPSSLFLPPLLLAILSPPTGAAVGMFGVLLCSCSTGALAGAATAGAGSHGAHPPVGAEHGVAGTQPPPCPSTGAHTQVSSNTMARVHGCCVGGRIDWGTAFIGKGRMFAWTHPNVSTVTL